MDRGNKEHWLQIVKRTGKCPFCPKHDVENRTRREKYQKGKRK